MHHFSRIKAKSRCLHSSSSSLSTAQILKPSAPPTWRPSPGSAPRADSKTGVAPKKAKEEEPCTRHAKRNEAGVQMLSRKLHAQLFPHKPFPKPNGRHIKIALEHLKEHGLDPRQGSQLPDVGFTLPQLVGENLDEHFWYLGASASEPWLGLARQLAKEQLPPVPEHWELRSGWTKYHHRDDGTGYSEAVDVPMHEGRLEELIVFDVETLPAYSPYPVMACAATPNGWYAWISPWLLGETEELRHLIPLGDPNNARIVVGHNVSYDRARTQEEYSVSGTCTRFLDTMSLHVAVKGISSHQRPAWNKHRKAKEKEREQREEAIDALRLLIEETYEVEASASDEASREQTVKLRNLLQDSLIDRVHEKNQDPVERSVQPMEDEEQRKWEDITSANSLRDVAKLHCDIELDKEVRNDFMTHSREEIASAIQDYLNYCASDVAVTHAVFAKTLPAFLTACPNPVSFAGMLTMGSSFLTLNQEWTHYIDAAEAKYKELEDGIRTRLMELVQDARVMMETETWRESPWLSQLDWTPKVAGASRGVSQHETVSVIEPETISHAAETNVLPAWYGQLKDDGLSPAVIKRIAPFLLRLSVQDRPLQFSSSEGWHVLADGKPQRLVEDVKVNTILGKTHGLRLLKKHALTSCDDELATALSSADTSAAVLTKLEQLAEAALQIGPVAAQEDPWLNQLDWKPAAKGVTSPPSPRTSRESKSAKVKAPQVVWPKWYWELTKPRKGVPPGTPDVGVTKRLTPLLFELSWLGWPLFYSREHGWTFRVPRSADFTTRATALVFFDSADEALRAQDDDFVFYKLPHKDGEKANVGNPLGKTFMKYAQDGTLTSPSDAAKDALDMNAQCSYWISARDRIMHQMVEWQSPSQGIVLPQVIAMGTVTRRAIERTWLTASNAKKNRVGSELKAMVRAPKGYAIVGADVDSEELWIASVMGDAQFGMHGATAIGWMTLEGTKQAGTDLHSKTASILGISRDQAKVFNYSRIYGAGMRHAILLLLQANASMAPEEAQKLAENLYASTKGKNLHRKDLFDRKFWYGGTESFVFNKLEEIALSDQPQTPALGCGVTDALTRKYLKDGFGTDYMTSRINWVVQSSGVDYLHMLIVAMDYLALKYQINARYLISVHDEVRYLVTEQDKYRAALALQIANLWTRSMFAYKLGMDDLPQGVAFFSAVDVDHVLRKEVDMPCVTPSQPNPIAPGESLDIEKALKVTHGGSLWNDGRAMQVKEPLPRDFEQLMQSYTAPDCLRHRADSSHFLAAQASKQIAEIVSLSQGARRVAHATTSKTQTKLKKPVDMSLVGDIHDPHLAGLAEKYFQLDARYHFRS